MSIETTNLLMESVIVGVNALEVAAAVLAAFGSCLLAVAVMRAARRTIQIPESGRDERAAPLIRVSDVLGIAGHAPTC